MPPAVGLRPDAVTPRPTRPRRPAGSASRSRRRELLAYLGGLEAWLAHRRTELDRLDAAAQASPATRDATRPTSLLALTMWQAIRTRPTSCVAVWDSGRADAVAARRCRSLIWGRLDSGLGAALVSLVEAVTLCDAMISKVARAAVVRPGHRGPGRAAARPAGRARAVRGPRGRRRGPRASRVAALRDRGSRSWSRRRRAAPTSPGRSPSSRRDGARAERDLIVQVSQRRTLEKGRADARADRCAALETAGADAARARATGAGARSRDPPKLAVPDVVPARRAARRPAPSSTRSSTGSRPSARRVRRRADAYSAPLRERAELRTARACARRRGRERPQRLADRARPGYDEAHAPPSTATPCDVTMARFLVEQYLYLTRDLPTAGQEGSRR